MTKKTPTLAALQKQFTAAQRNYEKAQAAYTALTNKRYEERSKLLDAHAKETNALLAPLDKASTVAYVQRESAHDALRRLKHAADLPPATGAFTCYKKAYYDAPNGDRYSIIITLHVPATAKRLCHDLHAFKMRVSKARVVAFSWAPATTYRGGGTGPLPTTCHSSHDRNFTYKIGKTVKPRRPFTLAPKVCASGIHAYMNRKHAQNH